MVLTKKIIFAITSLLLMMILIACADSSLTNGKEGDEEYFYEFISTPLNDEETIITSFIGCVEVDSIHIPNYLDGRRVVRIEPTAFVALQDERTKVSRIIISRYVRYIYRNLSF